MTRQITTILSAAAYAAFIALFTLAAAADAQSTGNNPPTGPITIQASGDDDATTSLTVVTIGARYDVGETTGGGDIMDADGNPTSLRKSWQRSSDGTTWTEAATFATNGNTNSYTVVEADRMAGHLRACVFFNDGAGNAEGGTATDAGTRASTATICAPTITTFNDASVLGAITAADGTDLTTTGPNEDNALTAPDPTDPNGVTNATFSWQWAQADSISHPSPDIITDTDATSATFIPLQAHVGQFLHVCARFTDDAGNAETACTDLKHEVVNVNDAPSGTIVLQEAGDSTATTGITSVAVGTEYEPGVSTGGSTLMDEDGIHVNSMGRFSWQRSADNGSTWSEAALTAYGTTGADVGYTPVQADADAGHLRVCFFYTDHRGTVEGGAAGTSFASHLDITEAQRLQGTICTAALEVTGGNNRATGTPAIHMNGQSMALERATVGDDIYAAVTSAGGETTGRVMDTDGVPDDDVPATSWQRSDDGGSTWRESRYRVNNGGAGYEVSADDGMAGHIRVCIFFTDEAGNAEGGSSAPADRLMGLLCSAAVSVIVPNSPASGTPALAYASGISAPTEESAITASQGTIMDADGITTFTVSWQWSAAADNGGTYADITGNGAATNAFTPQQAHVGMFLQVCAMFEDDRGADEQICHRIADAVANVNDAPMASSNTISVPVSSAYTFMATDFTFTDADRDMLASVTIESLPAEGTLANDGTAVVVDGIIDVADIDDGDLTYTPDAAAEDGNSITFTFNVTDDGSDGSGDLTSTNDATITLALTSDQPATGTPTLAYASGDRAVIGIAITAAPGNVADPDGIPASGANVLMFHWQQDDTLDGNFADIPATGTSYTPAAANAGNALRVCARFTDNAGNASERCSAATAAVNTPATVTADFGSGNAAPTLGQAVTATANDDADGTAGATFIWQWSRADSMGGAYTDIPSADMAAYTPVNDDVGKYLRASVSFTDDAGRAETASWEAAASVNARPTGSMAMNRFGTDTATQGIPAFRVGFLYYPAVATGGGTLADANGGLEVNTSGPDAGEYSNSTVTVSWQNSADGGTTWTERYSPTATGSTTTRFSYRASADDASAGHLRVCVFYTDSDGHVEGGARSTAAERQAGTLCSAAVPLNNEPDGTIAVTDANGTDFTATGPTVGAAITADASGITDGDSLGAFSWQWQSAAAPTGGGLPDDDDYANLDNPSAPANPQIYTPVDGDVGRHLRVCVSYTDGIGTAERVCHSFAHTVILPNNPATGTPALERTNAGATPQETLSRTVSQGSYVLASLTTNGGTVADPQLRGTPASPGTPGYWRQSIQRTSDTANGPWVESFSIFFETNTIIGPYKVAQADVDAGFLRACVFFTDSRNYAEGGDATDSSTRVTNPTLCSDPIAVTNANDAPTGLPQLVLAENVSNHVYRTVDSNGDALPAPSSLAQHDDRVVAVLSTGGTECRPCNSDALDHNSGPVMDEDGLPTYSTRGRWSHSIQRSSAASGAAWLESQEVYGGAGANQIYTPSEDDVEAGFLRVCVFYVDDYGTLEGVRGRSPAVALNVNLRNEITPAERLDGTLCSTPVTVTDTNTAPMPQGEHRISAFTSVSAAFPHIFTLDDFRFTDNDVPPDQLASVTILSLGTVLGGRLYLDGSVVDPSSYPLSLTRQQIVDGELGFAPSNNQSPTTGYGTIKWHMTDDGSKPDANTRTTSNTDPAMAATIRIDLVLPGPLPATGMPEVTAASGTTAYEEDNELTATTAGINDPNRIDESTLQWQWQAAAAADGSFAPIAGASASGTASIAFTPMQAQVGQYIRVCASFMDMTVQSDGTTPDPRQEGPLCSTPAQVTNVNDAPVSDNAAVNVFTTTDADTPYIFRLRDFPFTDEDTGDTLASITIAALTVPSGATFTDDGTAVTANTTVQAADIGNLQFYPAAGTQPTAGYATFTFTLSDGTASSGMQTMTINVIPPGPVAASGAPTVTPPAHASAGYTEDVQLSASTAGITEPNIIDESTLAWQWQRAAAADGRFAPIAGASASGTATTTFTPLQAQVGQYIRACASFRDMTVAGDGSTPDPRDEGPLCSAAAQVSNVNDAPASVASSVNVFTITDADSPYTFKAADFPFMDEDVGAQLASLTIVALTVPGGATFTNDGTAVTAATTVQAADIGNLQFYPAAATEVTRDYATFTFTLSDGMLSSSPAATMTIHVIPPGPVPATGMPAVTAATGTAYNEDVQLSAALGTVADDNGINMETLQWQWQQFDAATGTYMSIEGATAADFTPLNAHGGEYIRACLRFMDTHLRVTDEMPDPRPEGPLCSAPGQVAAINDAPTTADVSVNVAAATTADAPFAFTAAHFAYEDEEGAELDHITIVTPPANGTLRSGDPLAAVTAGDIDADAIAGLRWHPPAGAAAAQGYDRLVFTVNDGNSDSAQATITINLVPDDQEDATGAPTVTAASGMTAYNEDVELTASTAGITEPNTIDTATLSWQWQAAAAPDTGVPEPADYAAIADATAAAFTPLQAHVGQYLRVCASFADHHSTPAQSTLCTDGAIIANVDDAPTGMVTLAATGVDLTMAGPNEDAAITASHNIMDGDGLADDPSWQWSAADTASGPYTDIAMATAAAFTPLQEHVGKFLQACLSFEDANGNTGRECANTQMPAVNVNDAAGLADDGALISYERDITAATEDSPITASRDDIRDEDGITLAQLSWQWAQDAGGNGTFADIKDATATAFTPTNAQVGNALRVCVSFTDDLSEEVGMGMDATQSGAEQLCAITAPVANTNDAPVAAASTVHVPADATADNPHIFSDTDFPFMDDDQDTLASIAIVDNPPLGTLHLNGAPPLAHPASVTAEQLAAGSLAWFPPAGLSDAAIGYTSFEFRVLDNGDDGTTDRLSNNATLSIDLVASAQAAATGAPTVAATDPAMVPHNEDVPLSASASAIADVNGINMATLAWQWQQAAPITDEQSGTSMAPAADSADWAAIADADEAEFTPLQAQVGMYIRACASFMDAHPDPNAETRCSTPAIITGADDAVTGTPMVAAADRTNLATTSVGEGMELTASQGTIADEDGLPMPFMADWVWNLSDDAPGEQTAYTPIANSAETAGQSTYTPTQEQIGKYLQVCATISGDQGAGNPRCYELARPIINTNDAPQGQLAITYAGGITAATEDSPITAAQGTVTDMDGISTALAWQWHQAAADGDFEAIEGATAATFTPQQAHVGQVLRVCAAFTDDLGGEEQVCATAMDSSGAEPLPATVANANDAPAAMPSAIHLGFDATAASGAHIFSAADFPFTDEEDGDALASVGIAAAPTAGTLQLDETDATYPLTVTAMQLAAGDLSYFPAAGQAAINANYATLMFTVTDDGDAATGSTTSAPAALTVRLINSTQMAATGMPAVTPAASPGYTEDAELSAAQGDIADMNGMATDLSWQWQQAAAPEGGAAPADGDWAAIADADAAAFTPLQAHAGQYLRVCASFTDAHSTPRTETRCSAGALVNEVNDAPTSGDTQILVPADTTAAAPFMFTADNFPYEDEESTAPASITITSLPTAGTLRLITAGDGTGTATVTPVTPGTPIPAAAIPTLSYHPPGGTEATRDYASFTFTASDGSASSDPASTLSIHIVSPQQLAATGAPTVTPEQFNEDAELSATTAGITDYNLIDETTLSWQWQWSRAADTLFAPLADATDPAFTPTQQHVGLWLRACASFSDQHSTPAAEGPLCSAPAQVQNVNDAPQSADNFVSVFTNADAAAPYAFTTADFPIADEDSDILAAITLASLPVRGTLRLGDKLAATGQPIAAAAIPTLSFHPAANADPETAYDSFTFTISDGALSSTPANTISINLLAPAQLAATGTPALDSRYPAQNSPITASLGSVRDPNRINADTLSWQWQDGPAATGEFTDIEGGTAATFTPGQAQVDLYIRACLSFMDLFAGDDGTPAANAEGPLCSAATGPTANINDNPLANSIDYHPDLSGGLANLQIPVAAFQLAYSDPDAEADMLESVTITALPPAALGTMNLGGTPLTVPQTLTVGSGPHFEEGILSFHAMPDTRAATFRFTLSDGEAASNTGSITLIIGSDISREQVQQISAVLSVAATANATNAISGALSGPLAGGDQASGFDMSLGGTSLSGLSQSLQRGLSGSASPATDNADLPQAIATADQRAWFLGTADSWEYHAAYNASDNSAAALARRINAMANGDLALRFGRGGAAGMRYWARFQQLDLSGNPTQDDGTPLQYDGDSTGLYVGADRMVGDGMRAGLAIGIDSADISITLDEGNSDKDEASRSATSIYPYLRLQMGGGSEARLMAGFGSGDLDIKSSQSGTASAGLSWMMLAADLSHSRNLGDSLRTRFSGSLQYSDSSTDEATFSDAPAVRVRAATANSGELAFNAELGYNSGGMASPFVNAAARKWFGDLNQSLAYDLGAGLDLSSGPYNLRLAATRQLNDTTHERHSLSIDLGLNPAAEGLSATLGNRWDSLSGRPRWTGSLSWRRGAFQASLQAARADLRLHGQLRW